MTIAVGDKLPTATFKEKTADGPVEVTTDQLFAGKRVVLFAVPGAFTPTCSLNHLPGYLENRDAILARGVDDIAVVGVAKGPDRDAGLERFFIPGSAPDKRLFDLPGFVLWRLEQAGVGQAVWTGHDTCADAERFYSNRRAFQHVEPDFGRLIAVIGA